jgi:hypothetical protein
MRIGERIVKSLAAATLLLEVSQRVAMAQPPPMSVDTASVRLLVDEARARCARNDFADCLKSLQAADNLARTPETGLEVARIQRVLGLMVEARATLDRVLTSAPAANDPPESKETREQAQKLDDDLKERVPSLRFDVSGLAKDVIPTIWVDESVHPVPVETPLKVNPGRHVVVARTQTQQATTFVDARERSTAVVALNFRSATPSGASDAPAAPAGASASHSLPAAAYWGLGIGAAGFVVGGVTGVLAFVTKKGTDPRCAANQCPPASWNDYDPATKVLITTSAASALIGAAGVGLAVGSVLLHKNDESKSTSPSQAVVDSLRVTPALGGMSVSGKF